jgi:hypothetical protein
MIIILIPSQQYIPSFLNDASLAEKFHSHRFDSTAARFEDLAYTSQAR